MSDLLRHASLALLDARSAHPEGIPTRRRMSTQRRLRHTWMPAVSSGVPTRMPAAHSWPVVLAWMLRMSLLGSAVALVSFGGAAGQLDEITSRSAGDSRSGSGGGDLQGVSAEVWERCEERADSLARLQGSLIERADSLAGARRLAAEQGHGDRERWLLARGEAVAESISAVAAGRLAQELRCSSMAGELLARVDAELRIGSALLNQSLRDSLLRLRAGLVRGEGPAARIGLTLPEAADEDPPEVLRQKAAYARDLSDRAARWMTLIQRESNRLADESRIMEETRRLFGDQRLFDDGAALAVTDWGNIQIPGQLDDAGDRNGPAGLLVRLIEQMPGDFRPGAPEEVLEALGHWLALRSEELTRRASELEQEAQRRQREP
ncbi:MAG: hypothetical protein KAY24_03400 [Candidatus Eisenbacteria sp.]|nr:hypothetical protein [Candidatus Eisenbacteria bacterium]